VNGELILYTTPDGNSRIQLRAENGTVWLTQLEIAELFSTTVPNINMHIRNVLKEGEQLPEATIKEDLIVRQEGERTVQRPVKLYNLDMILAVGYRVRSHRALQFRQWATTTLHEFLIKGFVLNDERLKGPDGLDYFDELLQRIRDIRASDPDAANMGLTSWKGERVRQHDVTVAKNYLFQPEIAELNRIVTMYIDFAEDLARRRKQIHMSEWETKLDAFLQFNERDVLCHAGKVSAAVAEKVALDRYGEFDAKRRSAERITADTDDLEFLRKAEQTLEAKKPGRK
jgi:hypothetical protein